MEEPLKLLIRFPVLPTVFTAVPVPQLNTDAVEELFKVRVPSIVAVLPAALFTNVKLYPVVFPRANFEPLAIERSVPVNPPIVNVCEAALGERFTVVLLLMDRAPIV